MNKKKETMKRKNSIHRLSLNMMLIQRYSEGKLKRVRNLPNNSVIQTASASSDDESSASTYQQAPVKVNYQRDPRTHSLQQLQCPRLSTNNILSSPPNIPQSIASTSQGASNTSCYSNTSQHRHKKFKIPYIEHPEPRLQFKNLNSPSPLNNLKSGLSNTPLQCVMNTYDSRPSSIPDLNPVYNPNPVYTSSHMNTYHIHHGHFYMNHSLPLQTHDPNTPNTAGIRPSYIPQPGPSDIFRHRSLYIHHTGHSNICSSGFSNTFYTGSTLPGSSLSGQTNTSCLEPTYIAHQIPFDRPHPASSYITHSNQYNTTHPGSSYVTHSGLSDTSCPGPSYMTQRSPFETSRPESSYINPTGPYNTPHLRPSIISHSDPCETPNPGLFFVPYSGPSNTPRVGSPPTLYGITNSVTSQFNSSGRLSNTSGDRPSYIAYSDPSNIPIPAQYYSSHTVPNDTLDSGPSDMPRPSLIPNSVSLDKHCYGQTKTLRRSSSNKSSKHRKIRSSGKSCTTVSGISKSPQIGSTDPLYSEPSNITNLDFHTSPFNTPNLESLNIQSPGTSNVPTHGIFNTPCSEPSNIQLIGTKPTHSLSPSNTACSETSNIQCLRTSNTSYFGKSTRNQDSFDNSQPLPSTHSASKNNSSEQNIDPFALRITPSCFEDFPPRAPETMSYREIRHVIFGEEFDPTKSVEPSTAPLDNNLLWEPHNQTLTWQKKPSPKRKKTQAKDQMITGESNNQPSTLSASITEKFRAALFMYNMGLLPRLISKDFIKNTKALKMPNELMEIVIPKRRLQGGTLITLKIQDNCNLIKKCARCHKNFNVNSSTIGCLCPQCASIVLKQ